MRKSKVFFILIFLLVPVFTASSQDVSFSQFFANRLYLNPSWAGVGDEKRIFINYRNHYAGSTGHFNTYTLAYDQYVPKLSGGVGFSLVDDSQGSGAMNQLSFSGMYSYHFRTGRFLSFAAGLQASGVNRSINIDKLEFEDQSEAITIGKNSKTYADFSTGFAGFHKNFYGGVSLFHLLKPYQSESKQVESRLPRKFSLFAGTYIPVYERRLGKKVFQLNPNLIYSQQKDLSQIIYGLEALFSERYVAGIWARQNLGLKVSTIIFSGGISLDNIRLRYSYDSQFSRPSMQIPRMGANEISIIIAFADDKKNKHKAIKCPKF